MQGSSIGFMACLKRLGSQLKGLLSRLESFPYKKQGLDPFIKKTLKGTLI